MITFNWSVVKITCNFFHSQVHGSPFPPILSTDPLWGWRKGEDEGKGSVHGTLALLGSRAVCSTHEMNKLNPVTNTTEF